MSLDRTPLSWMAEELEGLAAQDLYRRRRVIEKRIPGRITIDGQDLIDVSSNDYLGLAADDRIRRAAMTAIEEIGVGAAASPLVNGYTHWHAKLEREIARFEGTEASIVFPTGFAANLGTISAIAGPRDVIFSERRNHASLIDGCRLSKANVVLYQGDQLDLLEESLRRETGYRRRLIVTDSVFSMDGDIAPLADLAELAERYDAMLYVDEAHATGVLGEHGRGACELLGIEDRVTIRMGTLSKALGSAGGFVSGPQPLIDWLVNRVRPYIYSTGLPAGTVAAAAESLRLVRENPSSRQHVLALGERLRQGLRARGLDPGLSQTPIVPLIVGQPAEAMGLAASLQDVGFFAVGIRPPTVAVGTARVRLSLSAAHTVAQIDELLSAISELIVHG